MKIRTRLSLMLFCLLVPFSGNAIEKRADGAPVLRSVLDNRRAYLHGAGVPAPFPGGDAYPDHGFHFPAPDPEISMRDPYKQQRRIAIGLTITGSVLTGLGGALLISLANEPPESDRSWMLALQTIGFLALIAGLCMLIPGIVRLTRL